MNGARAVLALACFLFLWNLWGYDLAAPDEPYFAEGAREMLAEGRWRVPHVNGEVTTDKPPLVFWLIALFSLPEGSVTSLSARLPSALAACGSVILTMRLGRRHLGPAGASLAGLILCTSYLFWDKARSAQIDSLLCFLVLCALGAFDKFRSGEGSGVKLGLMFWAASALAVVAKGPVGFLLPLGIALATLAWDGNLRAWRRFAPLGGPILFLVAVGAWMALASTEGNYSVFDALRTHVFERATSGLHHVQPPWYYLEVLPVKLLPWSLAAPAALWFGWKERRGQGGRFFLAWAAFVVLFFSIWTEKRDLYVLPAFPAFALLTAAAVERLASAPLASPAPWLWLRAPQALTGALMALAGAAVPLAASKTRLIAGAAVWAPAAALIAGGTALAWIACRHPPRATARATAAAAALAFLSIATFLYPALEPRTSARAFASEVSRLTAEGRGAGGTIYSYGLGNITDALNFYSEGIYVRRVGGTAELLAALAGSPDSYALADRSRLPESALTGSPPLRLLLRATVGGKEVVLLGGPPRSPAADAGGDV
jgi:4-amino-4-deoxy-L-arabinose transferase-like glycosyltransferase